jgi:transposase-like protein
MLGVGLEWMGLNKTKQLNMTKHPSDIQNTDQDIVNVLLNNGLIEAMRALMQRLLNETMKEERNAFLHAKPYERSLERKGYANGFKPKNYNTGVGEILLSIPQTRDSQEPFYPTVLERGTRCERALKLAIAEMYVKGVSTRKVKEIVEKLCGLEITSSQVSRIASELDEELEKWRNRPLQERKIRFLFLDATYVKCRIGGIVRDVALLTAIGVRDDGKRMVLGTSVSLNEAEVHWRTFLQSLKERGMSLPELIISDAHEGLKAARQNVFNASLWQRCQFHIQQNAQAYVTKQEQRPILAREIRLIFDSPDLAHANEQLSRLVEKYKNTLPAFSAWLEESIPESLTVFSFEESVRKKLRTSNIMENTNRQLKRRIRVVGLFPNESSLLRLSSALLAEISDEWESSSKHYMVFEKNS